MKRRSRQKPPPPPLHPTLAIIQTERLMLNKAFADLEERQHSALLDIIEKDPPLLEGERYPVPGDSDDIVLGSWACHKGPVGLCVYDEFRDPQHDTCLYCHLPEERK